MPGKKVAELQRREQILDATYQVAAAVGLWETTIQRVAERAKVSPGLVIFHFESRRQLLLALLDHLLATTTVLCLDPETATMSDPLDQLIAVVRHEMNRLTSEPLCIRLTFDFWMAGVRDAAIREKLQTEFARYRESFHPLAAGVLRAEPERFSGVTPEGLAGVIVSLIKGCAVQSMIDADHFDGDHHLRAVVGLIGKSVSFPAMQDAAS
jgi:AcrR family transcriptional regulator